jgi:pimeloyl-ACP methyl ester carboxylesterase
VTPQPVLLLHGLLMRRPALWLLARRLRQRGFAPILFDYPTLWRSPAVAMERLAMRLYAFGNGPVHIVAHSLGGLIAVQACNQFQQLPPGRIVCLGSPLAGSSAARGLADKHLGWMAGRSGPLLRGGLAQLPAGRRVGMVAGVKSMGLGKYFGPLDGPNDGTVAVWETQLPGMAGHVTVPSSHSGLVLSPLVAELAGNFLETGFFQP